MSWPDIPKIPGVNLPELSGFREKRDSIEESIEQYFSKAELSNISEYEKKRLRNMKKNYVMLLSLGLPVSKPDFMKGPRARKKAKKIVEDSDSDEEWTPKLERRKSSRTVKVPEPFVMPCFSDPAQVTQNNNKQKRKRSGESEITVKKRKIKSTPTERTVYPKRNQSVVNYMDIEVPDDDSFIYCEECNKEYDGDCPVHGSLITVEDTPVPCNFKSQNRADQSVPSCLMIKQSQIPGAGQGIWVREAIPARSRFGPYVGETIMDLDQAHSTGYSWQIYKDGKASHFVDATNPQQSNWMRYVNCARTEAEQNLTAFQYRGQVYYRSHKPIEAEQELLVWYGQEYGKELGIRRGSLDEDGPVILKSPVSGAETCVYCCRQCPHIEFSTRIKYYRHRRRKHGSVIPADVLDQMRKVREKSNQAYGNEFSHSESNVNITDERKDSKYKCSVCGYKFGSPAGLTRHMGTHTGEKPFKCSVCEYRCTVKDSLTKHMRTHTGEKPFKCSVCEYRCVETGHLTKHLRTHSGEKPFKCSLCEYRCFEIGHLTKHLRTHKPFKCSLCEYRCTRQNNLTRHMRTHTGEKPFKCSVCEYRFTVKDSLTKHMRTHTGEKPFKCSLCEYRCTEAGHLTKHLRTHTGEKHFKCSLCEYRCAGQENLTRHMRTHTGEKPFKCSVCEYRCNALSNLTRHMRTHTGEKLFKCQLCNYRCSNPNSLRWHTKSHRTNNFECSVCLKNFSKQSDLVIHEKIHLEE